MTNAAQQVAYAVTNEQFGKNMTVFKLTSQPHEFEIYITEEDFNEWGIKEPNE
jgi:hypothetical protein